MGELLLKHVDTNEDFNKLCRNQNNISDSKLNIFFYVSNFWEIMKSMRLIL